MWHYISTVPLPSEELLEAFERKFYFRIPEGLKKFLCACNGGQPVPPAPGAAYNTSIGERSIRHLLSFNPDDAMNAWDVNRKMRETLGPRRIAFAVDNKGDLLCLQRDHKQRSLVMWSFQTFRFENVEICLGEFAYA